MVRVKRAMTPMGIAMAAGKEIISIHYDHTPARVPSTRPQFLFKENGGNYSVKLDAAR